MNPRNTLIIATVTLLLILSMGAGTLYILFFAPKETISVSSDPFSKVLPFSDPKSNTIAPTSNRNNQTVTGSAPSTISIRTLNGFVDVRDFTKDVDVRITTEGDSFYIAYPAEGASTYQTLEYEIDYIPNEQRISVLIYKEPIGEIRLKIANDLTQRLSVSPLELCALDVLVVAPRWVNDYYADKNLGFPGCPGAVKFQGDPTF